MHEDDLETLQNWYIQMIPAYIFLIKYVENKTWMLTNIPFRHLICVPRINQISAMCKTLTWRLCKGALCNTPTYFMKLKKALFFMVIPGSESGVGAGRRG